MLTEIEINEYDIEKQDNKQKENQLNVIYFTEFFYKRLLNILSYPLKLFYRKPIVGYLLEGSIWRSGYVKPSSYKLDNLKLDIDYLQKYHNDDYLLCISYNEGDTQIGLTGTVKVNENPIDTAIRELHEETTNFLSLDKKCVTDWGTDNYITLDVKFEFNQLNPIIDSKNRNINRFTYKIDYTSHVECTNIPNNTNADDVNQKVCLYIHGSKEILQSKFIYFNEYDNNKEVGVKGIYLIAIKDLYDML